MFKKFVWLYLVVFSLCLMSDPVQACVGRFLYVGALDNSQDRVMSELLVTLINERTGTNVQIRYFKNEVELYEAMKSTIEGERVDIIVEDTGDALAILKKERQDDPNQEYTTVKDLYDRELDIIWLNPFGFSKNSVSPSVSAPLLRRDVLTNFPLLPRILNKLAGVIDNNAYLDITAKVTSGDKPKNVAKDFLRVRKLI